MTYYWMNGVLQKLGAPLTVENHDFLYAWWAFEGGNNGPNRNIFPSAKFNWLNSMLKTSTSSPYNSVGIQNYPTWDEGVKATVATLKQSGPYPSKPDYRDIVAALKSGVPLDHWPVKGLATWLTGKQGTAAGFDYQQRIKNLTASLA